ncbi:hypothetical protein [Halobaculum marinum]|uniref:Uncharacterized protein n=1 Tax=Halobaculum marinum TaxID=3031996 RepID=A0ABD5WXP4_9EURY|nr:hypothetical protein [Halobaculum sp. DT55]
MRTPADAVTVQFDRRLVAVALFATAMPAVMVAVDRGLVPAFSVAEPVWWLLVPLAAGFWVAWVWWAEAGE